MRLSDHEKKWAIAVFALITLLGLIVAFTVPPNIAWVLIVGLALLQFLLIWIRREVVHVFYKHQNLQQSYEKEISFTEQIINNIDHGITVLDEIGRFIYVNQAYANLLGLPPSKIVGRTPFDFTLPEDYLSLEEAFIHRQKGENTAYTTQLRHINGHVTTVLISGSPRWHDGRVVGNFAAVIPVDTIHEQLENQQQNKMTSTQQPALQNISSKN